MQFIFEQIRSGGDRNFGYLIGDREAGSAVLIDPSYSPEVFVERAEAQGLGVELVINTHGHNDHTNGNAKVQELTGAKLAIYGAGDLPLEDGQELFVGKFPLRIYYTPGHAQDHIVIYQPDFHLLITGDHLFVGKIGGTATEETSRQQYDGLQRMLRELPPETTVWPGHDYGCRPASTLQLEKAMNPFLLVPNFEAFLALKQGWAQLKAEKGLK